MGQFNNVFMTYLPPDIIHAVLGIVILFGGLLAVKIIVGILRKILGKWNFSAGDDDKNNLITPLLSIVKGVLTIFVFMAVLDHYGLKGVLAPLNEMLVVFMGSIPNIIGAGIIGYVGWILAKILAQIVETALLKVDKKIADKIGNNSMRIAKFGSAFVFATILLPISVAALGVLDIPAISDPASSMINQLMSAVPNMVGATVIVAVTYAVAKFIISIFSGLLEGMRVNELPEKIGIGGVFNANFTVIKLIGNTIMFFAMVSAATAAVNILEIDIISNIFARIIEFGGGVLIGGVILVIGNFLSMVAHKKLTKLGNTGLANIARIAIIGLVLAMGLKAMGLADNIVTMAFGFTLGSVAVASALAFGLGGRDAAKTITDKLVDKLK